MLKKALELGGPKAVRWPRGSTQAAPEAAPEDWDDIAWGSWERVKDGTDATILAVGPMVDYALTAVAGDPRVGVVNARFVKPVDLDMLVEISDEVDVILTAEDHALAGGFGSAVAEAVADHGLSVRIERLGIPDTTVPHGDPAAQHERLGYGPRAIRERLREVGVVERGTLAEASD